MSGKAALQPVKGKAVDVTAGEDMASIEISGAIFCLDIINALRSDELAGSIRQGMRPSVVEHDHYVLARSLLPLNLKRMIIRSEDGGIHVNGVEAAKGPNVVEEL